MESPVLGLIAQLKGSPTKSRYCAATVFVDHYSDHSFVYLQSSLTADETLKAKKEYEKYCLANDVKVMHYHADNGRFAETKFLAAVAAKGQTISFCGVNAHFQNGRAERRIRTLQDLARTAILHAKSKWPMAITSNLWPYAIRSVNDSVNHCIR